jgi:hypothetical protein
MGRLKHRGLVLAVDSKVLESAGMGPPITYMVGGKQYVALLDGIGRPAPTVGPTDAKLDTLAPPTELHK